MSDQGHLTGTRRSTAFTAGAGLLMLACCAAGPALLAAFGGLAVGTLLAPIVAVVLVGLCLVIAWRFARQRGRC